MGLRSKLINGFKQLLSKSAVASLLGFITLLAVIEIIGLNEYGRYAGAFALFIFIEALLKVEIKLVLVKYDHQENVEIFNTAFSFLFFMTVASLGIIWGLWAVIPESLNPYREFTGPILMLSFVLPIAVLTDIPRAILERDMKFDLISRQELWSAVFQHTSCIIVVLISESLLGLVVSWYVYNIAIAYFSWKKAGYIPTFSLDKSVLNKLLYHSKHLFAQNILSQGKRLVNPIIVGYFVGAQGVGIVSFAEKVVYGLSFFRNALHRVSISMLGNLKEKDPRFIVSIRESTLLQMLPLGGILLAGSFAVYLVSLVTDQIYWQWLNVLYPFVAIDFFFFVTLTIPMTALQMHNYLQKVTGFWIVFNVLFFSAALVGVYYRQTVGYGIALLIAVPSYFLLFNAVKQQAGEILTDNMKILMVCICIALMWYHIGYFALCALPALYLVPGLIRKYRKEWHRLMRPLE